MFLKNKLKISLYLKDNQYLCNKKQYNQYYKYY